MTNPGVGPAVIPCLRYRDAAAALAWLCDAFGFERQLVVPGEGGPIAHAQLTLGGGMLMIGSARGDEGRAGGPGTQSIHVVTPDPDGLYARVRAAGATIEVAIKDEAFGGRAFSCRDPEGHLWSFGSYDPWRGA